MVPNFLFSGNHLQNQKHPKLKNDLERQQYTLQDFRLFLCKNNDSNL